METWLSILGYFVADLAAAFLLLFIAAISEYIFGIHDRHYTLGDPTLSYPFKRDTIPSFPLVIGVLVIWTILLTSRTFLSTSQLKPRSSAAVAHPFAQIRCEVVVLSVTLVEAQSMSMILTKLGKITAGRYRPDFLARLAMNNQKIIEEGRFSFPSGHASFSFCAMTVLACYLGALLEIFSHKKQDHTQLRNFSKVLFAFVLPFIAAGWVAVSRTMDYKHDFADINGGAIIGMLSGVVAYFANFPSLFSEIPIVPRIYDLYIRNLEDEDESDQEKRLGLRDRKKISSTSASFDGDENQRNKQEKDLKRNLLAK